MRKFFTTMLLLAVTTAVFPQMHIWRNGTIIFSHDASDVDSISFEGTSAEVQAVTHDASALSLAGGAYTAYLTTTGAEHTDQYYLFFVDDQTGYYARNSGAVASPTTANAMADHQLFEFTYTVSGTDLTLTFPSRNKTTHGRLIGLNALVFTDWSVFYGENQPVSFISLTLR